MSYAQNEVTHEINMAEVTRRVPNRFLLCVAAAKRARQIKDALPTAQATDEPVVPVLEALQEIVEGKLVINVDHELEHTQHHSEKMERIQEQSSQGDKDSKGDKKSVKDVKSKSKSKSLAA